MPYNYKGDLYKREVVKNCRRGTTDAGAKFSMWHKGVLNSDAWHPELVDEVTKFLKKK